MSEEKKLVTWFDHGLGDCCHYAAVLKLYQARGHDVHVHYDRNKTAVFEAAGCNYHPVPENYHRFPYYAGFNHPNPGQDWSGSKVALNLNTESLPPLGDRAEVWEELCRVNLEDSFDKVLTPEMRIEAVQFLSALPRPVVLIHSKGTNFQRDKSIPDHEASKLYEMLLDGMSGSLVLLDWDHRVPTPAHARVRHTKRDWGHISVHQLACLMVESDLLIGIDSGPYHLAALTRCPALGVFTHFYPSCVSLPRVNLKSAVMTRNADTYRPVNQARRKRWSVLEYSGTIPTAADIAKHALRMLAGPRYGCPIGRDVMIQQWVRDWLRSSTSTSSIADRHNTMDWLLRETTARFTNPQVVETGCIRSREDWSAGYSSYLLGAYLDGRQGGKLVSVDIDAGNCRTARELCQPWGGYVEVVESDSVKYLAERDEGIDVLFLDSMDCEDPRHSSHGLAEVKAAEKLLGEKAIVGFDDTVWAAGQWKGKGGLGVPYLIEKKWKVGASGYQTFLVREGT